MSAEPRKTGSQGADANQSQEARLQRRAAAAEQLDQRFERRDGATIVNSLADGLNLLRDLLYTRVHGDVEQRVGLDSMMVSTAALKQPELGRNEIELYEIAETAATVADKNYLDCDDAWRLDWLGRLRLGEAFNNPVAATRVSSYLARSADDRRRLFAQILERSLPEASARSAGHLSALSARRRRSDLAGLRRPCRGRSGSQAADCHLAGHRRLPALSWPRARQRREMPPVQQPVLEL